MEKTETIDPMSDTGKKIGDWKEGFLQGFLLQISCLQYLLIIGD